MHGNGKTYAGDNSSTKHATLIKKKFKNCHEPFSCLHPSVWGKMGAQANLPAQDEQVNRYS